MNLFYILPFALAGISTLLISAIAWPHRLAPKAWYLILMCLAASFWSLCESLLYFGFPFEIGILITKIQYFGILTCPLLTFLFVFSSFGSDAWITRKRIAWLSLIPFITLLLVWTNSRHHLIWKKFWLIHDGPFPMLGLQHGPFFWVFAAYSYAVIFAIAFVLLRCILLPASVHRRQGILLFLTVGMTTLCNIIYLTGKSPVYNVDLTSLTFSLMSGVLAWGFLRYKFLGIIPAAKTEIFISLTNGVLVLDFKNRLIDMNPAAEGILGLKCPKVLGLEFNNVFNHETALLELFQNKTTGQVSLSIKGEQRIFDLEVSTLHNQRYRQLGWLLTFRDITDLKRAEHEKAELKEKLIRSQKMETLGLLAGGVAHDLNNVLSGIVSYPELLLIDLPPDSRLRKPILTIQQSGEKAVEIVKDLLTLARRGVSATDVLNLNDIILEYLESPEYYKLLQYHPDVSVETGLEDDLLNMEGASAHLRKVVMNLVSNAAEAQPNGGNIIIRTRNRYLDKPLNGYQNIREGEFITLEIEDRGTGISPGDLDKIFEPFYTKKVMGRSGTGLGMTVVWGTVQDHDGAIDIRSEEGVGTTFSLYFPASRKTATKTREKIPIEKFMGSREIILVVDDVKEQREIAAGILEKLNYRVQTAPNGEEAISYLKTSTAELLVLDMIMDPGMDGLETFKKIRERHPGQKALIASGFAETDRVKEALSVGVGEFISKPYTMEKIGIAVKRQLSAH
jgi:PAS domain S-box-containing protein